jgi:hypothetical protein
MAWTASAECERAIRNINLILADTRRHVASLDARTSMADVERTRALALGAMVSVSEDYCQAVLDELVVIGVKSNSTGQWLWDQVATRAYMAWDSHLGLWARWGVDVFKSSEYKDFDGLIEARNAAMHGLGELTRVQQRKKGTVARIRGGGLKVLGTRVQIDDGALRTCRARTIDFLRYLDREYQTLRTAP